MDRESNLKRVVEREDPWDLVVIGGGATGAYCALDAASRGFSVLLLEQHDFGKGTSSRSTKLIHGGVRYLRQGNISLVRESLRERGLLLKNAPHVVQKLDFVIPCYSLREKYFYGLGMKIYDLLAGKYSIGRSQILDRSEVIERLPNVEQKGLKGGVLYYDGQFDDTRLLIDILRTADSHGAAVLNYARASRLKKTENAIVAGVEFEDVETGSKYIVGAKSVINAAGAFCSSVQEMSGENAPAAIAFSQGVHLVFDRKFLPHETAMLIPRTNDGRVLFCIPWKGHLLIGTTDTPVEKPELEPRALAGEVAFILETASKYLTMKPAMGDIRSVFAGIRPLIKRGSTAKTSSLSRSHELFVNSSGLVTITGGKWTTARKMAEDAVNKALEIAKLEMRESITADLQIEPPEHVTENVRLHELLPITRGEILRAIRNEMARTVEDVLARRTGVLFLDAMASIELAPLVAEMLADKLGRNEIWLDKSVNEFRSLAAAYTPGFYR